MRKAKLQTQILVTDDGKCCSDGYGGACQHYRKRHKHPSHKCDLFECMLHPTVTGLPLRCSNCVGVES